MPEGTYVHDHGPPQLFGKAGEKELALHPRTCSGSNYCPVHNQKETDATGGGTRRKRMRFSPHAWGWTWGDMTCCNRPRRAATSTRSPRGDRIEERRRLWWRLGF